jgi:hypothetical protein
MSATLPSRNFIMTNPLRLTTGGIVIAEKVGHSYRWIMITGLAVETPPCSFTRSRL